MIFNVLVTVQTADIGAVEFRFKIFREFHVHISRADSIFADVRNFYFKILQIEFIEFSAQIIFGHAELKARAQEHVAAYARRAVQIQCFHKVLLELAIKIHRLKITSLP